MSLSNDVKKALQALRKDVGDIDSHVNWLLNELERHLNLKSDAPVAAPAPTPVAATPTLEEVAPGTAAEVAPPANKAERAW